MSSSPPKQQPHPPPHPQTAPSHAATHSRHETAPVGAIPATHQEGGPSLAAPLSGSPTSRKRKVSGISATDGAATLPRINLGSDPGDDTQAAQEAAEATPSPVVKKSRTNTPWSPAEEQRLKTMRDAGNSWSEIAKVTFPLRTEGSVKKHWYKDMHYADFAEDESAALLAAIKEYEASKWKVIGQKVGKPAKACEQYAKEHFAGRL
ncbi:hypothetical protein MMC09_002545 [Bachmanniomyces sp. S44760]|nr:hypothetical protein [Bachmanniomyces sp. S44760]